MPSRNAMIVGMDPDLQCPASSCSTSVLTLACTMSRWAVADFLLEHRREGARTAPGGPEIDQHDRLLGDRLLGQPVSSTVAISGPFDGLEDTPLGML